MTFFHMVKKCLKTRSQTVAAFSIVGFALLVIFITSGCSGDGVGKHANWAEIQEMLPVVPDLTHANPEFAEKVQAAAATAFSGDATADSVVALSRLYHANGYLQEAMACYEALLQLDPENPRWKHLLAFLLSTYGYADDAELLWKDVIETASDYIPAKIRLADVYLKSNRLDEAKALYEKVESQESQNPYAFLGLARVAISQERWSDARELLESASKYSGGKIGKDLLVTVYEQLGNMDLAQVIRGETKASGSFVDIPDAWLEDVMLECYDATQLMNIGGLAAFAGDQWKGIEWLKRADEVDPENPMVHFQLAMMYHQVHQTALALKHYEIAAQLKPDFSDAWLKQVEIEEGRGNQTRADEIFYAGLMKCPQSPAYNLQYGMRLMKTGDRKQAQSYLAKAIELNPNEAAAYIQMSSNCFAMDRSEQGREYLEKALQVEPGNRLAMLTLCFYYIQSDNREGAQTWLEKIERHPRIDAGEKLNMKLKFQERFD